MENWTDDELRSAVKQMGKLLTFLINYSSVEIFQSDDITSLYLQEGADAASQYARENYQPLLDSESSAAQAYGQILQIWANRGMAAARFYLDNNCIVRSGTNIDISVCPEPDLTTDYEGQVAAIMQSDSYQFIGEARASFFDDCYYVGYTLNFAEDGVQDEDKD